MPIELAQELHVREKRPFRLELARELLSRGRATRPAAAGPSFGHFLKCSFVPKAEHKTCKP